MSRGRTESSASGAAICSAVGSSVCSAIGAPIGSSVLDARGALGTAVCWTLSATVGSAIGSSVGSAVGSAVATHTEPGVGAAVRASILDTGDPLGAAVSRALEAGSALIGILC